MVWSFLVDLGADPATGRCRQARRSGFATKKAAKPKDYRRVLRMKTEFSRRRTVLE